MKLLVMGAGYIGTAFLKRLSGKDYGIITTTTQKDKIPLLKEISHEVFFLEATREEEFKVILNSCDGIVIMVAPKPGHSYEDTYLNTALRIEKALQDRKTPISLLYTSSTSVYEGHAEWVSEETILHPTSPHANILMEAENIYLHSRAQTCILRLGGIYGPQRGLLERARRFSGQTLPGTGNEPTNHIHVDDAASALLFCLENRLRGVYNLVNDDHPTRKDLYSEICQSHALPTPVWNTELPAIRLGGYKVSNQKIKAAGFNFCHPLLTI